MSKLQPKRFHQQQELQARQWSWLCWGALEMKMSVFWFTSIPLWSMLDCLRRLLFWETAGNQGVQDLLQTSRHIDHQSGSGEPDVGDVGDGDVENCSKRVVTVEQRDAGFKLRPARQQGEDEKPYHSLGCL